jgi:septal ring factor EnvC (AmiA/AmiB activator)
MNTQFIFLTQTATSAMIEIALLLLGAGLIGFLTAWFYQKSVFTPVIKRLETEKEELNRKIEDLNKKISGLNSDITGFKTRIAELENIISEKNKEIELLKKPKK